MPKTFLFLRVWDCLLTGPQYFLFTLDNNLNNRWHGCLHAPLCKYFALYPCDWIVGYFEFKSLDASLPLYLLDFFLLVLLCGMCTWLCYKIHVVNLSACSRRVLTHINSTYFGVIFSTVNTFFFCRTWSATSVAVKNSSFFMCFFIFTGQSKGFSILYCSCPVFVLIWNLKKQK